MDQSLYLLSNWKSVFNSDVFNMCIHTLTVVRLSNVKDLICPFSKNTFNTFGMSSKESSLSIVWEKKHEGKESFIHLVGFLCFITEAKIDRGTQKQMNVTQFDEMFNCVQE